MKANFSNMNDCKFCPLFTLPATLVNFDLVVEALEKVTQILKTNYHSGRSFEKLFVIWFVIF